MTEPIKPLNDDAQIGWTFKKCATGLSCGAFKPLYTFL